MLRRLAPLAVAAATTLSVATQTPPAPTPAAAPQQQASEVQLVISGEIGAPPRYAVPDFIALSQDAETMVVSREIGAVLWGDLAFEREFYMIPRDTYATIPPARSATDVPFNRWKELGADAVVIGSVQRADTGVTVQVRLFDVRTQRTVFAKEYTGSAANPRLYAHTVSDEIHHQQRGLRGVARTKLAFSSDRDGERMTDSYENRTIKEIYISDYDGANQRRITVTRSLNVFPAWSADARAIAYTTYRRGFPDIYISNIYEGTLEQPTGGKTQSWLQAWSPDGTRLAFVSNRDGNPELYVMNRDGSGLRRLTNHPGIDSTPTWSPGGNQLAFTSDRSGSPQIFIIDVESSGNPRRITFESYCDRPTWSPAPFNEIAYASRSGPGFDVRILDLASGERRQVTFGEGTNESPCYAPNGRHLAFTSTRTGKTQVFTIARDGKDLRQLTRDGNNFAPNWSR